MIFRLTAPNVEYLLWLTYHHVHLWHIFTYINPHIISFTSPILISGTRDNIFPSHITSPQIYVRCVQQPGTNWRLPPDPLYIYHVLYRRRYAGGQLSVASAHCRRAFVYLYHGHWSAGRLHPASSNWDIADMPYIFRRRNSPDLSAQVQQPSLLNIDLHSTIREQQVQTSNIISTDKYNPVRVTHQYM